MDQVPALKSRVRAWDLAATPRDEENGQGPRLYGRGAAGPDDGGTYYVLDVRRLRGTPQQVQALVRQTAEEDGRPVAIWMEQEPGSAGVTVIDHYVTSWAASSSTASVPPAARRTGQPLAAQAEGGTVKLLRGVWNKDFLDEMEMFPFGRTTTS